MAIRHKALSSKTTLADPVLKRPYSCVAYFVPWRKKFVFCCVNLLNNQEWRKIFIKKIESSSIILPPQSRMADGNGAACCVKVFTAWLERAGLPVRAVGKSALPGGVHCLKEVVRHVHAAGSKGVALLDSRQIDDRFSVRVRRACTAWPGHALCSLSRKGQEDSQV